MTKPNLSRRSFITALGAGAGVLLTSRSVLALTSDWLSSSTDPLQMVSLGKTGIRTTLLGMGTGFSGYNRSSAITRAGVAESMIREAYEKGIRFFDCSDTYGTHPYLAAALKPYPRESYVICTKIRLDAGGLPEKERPDADISIERFRKELNTDYIDLVQIHAMTDPEWTTTYRKQMDIMEKLKQKNIIRAHGASIHSLGALEAAAASKWVDVTHVRINAFGNAMDHHDPARVTPVIEKLHKAGQGVIGMKLIANGKHSKDPAKIDESVRFVLGLGTVDMIIVGFEKPEQIDDYLERMRRALTVLQKK